MAIQFHFEKATPLLHRKALKEFISLIFKKENKEIKKLNYIFCDNGFLLDINRRFLNHDYFTDIITFDLSAPHSKKTDAEIYISVEMVKSNSIEFQASFKRELHRVIFHGVLHLCGFKDKSLKDKEKMREREEFYLDEYANYLKSL